jgi:hypothetical protein
MQREQNQSWDEVSRSLQWALCRHASLQNLSNRASHQLTLSQLLVTHRKRRSQNLSLAAKEFADLKRWCSDRPPAKWKSHEEDIFRAIRT